MIFQVESNKEVSEINTSVITKINTSVITKKKDSHSNAEADTNDMNGDDMFTLLFQLMWVFHHTTKAPD